MKPCRLRPRAREDRRDEVRYYRRQAGTKVAASLVGSLRQALTDLQRNPGIGSPALGKELGIDGLRTWLIDGFPPMFWYFERESYVDVVRLVGERQDAMQIEPA